MMQIMVPGSPSSLSLIPLPLSTVWTRVPFRCSFPSPPSPHPLALTPADKGMVQVFSSVYSEHSHVKVTSR